MRPRQRSYSDADFEPLKLNPFYGMPPMDAGFRIYLEHIFDSFKGSTYNPRKLGVFDYLTLCIPRLFDYLVVKCNIWANERIDGVYSPIRIAISWVLSIINFFTFSIPKAGFSLAMTIVSIPFIAIGFGINRLKKRFYPSELDGLYSDSEEEAPILPASQAKIKSKMMAAKPIFTDERLLKAKEDFRKLTKKEKEFLASECDKMNDIYNIYFKNENLKSGQIFHPDTTNFSLLCYLGEHKDMLTILNARQAVYIDYDDIEDKLNRRRPEGRFRIELLDDILLKFEERTEKSVSDMRIRMAEKKVDELNKDTENSMSAGVSSFLQEMVEEEKEKNKSTQGSPKMGQR
jgi:hypothetical protein